MELERTIDEIIALLRADRALVGDGPALRARLAAFDDDALRAIAAHARTVWQREAHGNIDRTLGAALVARAVYGALGDEAHSLRAGYEFLQTRFLLTDDVAGYASVRRQLGTLSARAAELGVLDLAFSATTSIADCTFFALGASEAGAERARIVDALVEDLLVACDALRRCPACPAERPVAYERFVSLSAAAYEAIEQVRSEVATLSAWLPDEASHDALATRMRGLAAAIEALVPDDFVYSGGTAQRSAQTAGTLARLSSEHGTTLRARSRLRASLRGG